MELLNGGKNIFEMNNQVSHLAKNLNALTCGKGHTLLKHTSILGGCCDVRDGVRMCSEIWERGETANVWACFDCNFWACEDCYNYHLQSHNSVSRGSASNSSSSLACRKPEFAVGTIKATIISFNEWFKKRGRPLDETAWIFPADTPPEILECLKNCHESTQISKLLDKEVLKIVVDTETNTIEKRAAQYNKDFKIDKEAIDKIGSGGDAMLFSLVHLNIKYEGWDYRLGMIKMYDGREILTLSSENKYVFMGTDSFSNIWVRFFIPGTSISVIITYLKNTYNFYKLVKEYNNPDNLILDTNNKYKGVRFLPLSGKVTNDSMAYMLGVNNDGCSCAGLQVEGVFGVTGDNMLTLNVTALTVMRMRSAGGPKRTNTEGFIDFFDKNQDTNCAIGVYSKKELLHFAVYNESNYTD